MAKTTRAGKPKEPHDRAPSMVGGIKRADFVSALSRGLEVLRLFSEAQPTLSTSEVADLTGLSRAAARRFLLTLTELGYLRNQGEIFAPQPKILELGYTYLSTWRFPELVQPHLQEVVDILHENCSFAVLDGADVVYLARAETRRIVQSINVSIGTRIPATLSSLGRVLLAYESTQTVDSFLRQHPLRAATRFTVTDPMLFRERLAAIQTQGWTLLNGEFEEDLLSLAVPVFAHAGQPIGAINVGAPASRTTTRQMEEDFLPVLQSAAAKISRAIEATGRDVSRLATVRLGGHSY